MESLIQLLENLFLEIDQAKHIAIEAAYNSACILTSLSS